MASFGQLLLAQCSRKEVLGQKYDDRSNITRLTNLKLLTTNDRLSREITDFLSYFLIYFQIHFSLHKNLIYLGQVLLGQTFWGISSGVEIVVVLKWNYETTSSINCKTVYSFRLLPVPGLIDERANYKELSEPRNTKRVWLARSSLFALQG